MKVASIVCTSRMPRLHDCKVCQVVCTCMFVCFNSEHAIFPATTQICTTELLLSPGPLLCILTKLWDGVQARLIRGVYRLGKLGCSSAVPSLKQPSCKACNRCVGCVTLYRFMTHNHTQMACILHVAVVGIPRHASACLYMANGDGCIHLEGLAASLSTDPAFNSCDSSFVEIT